MKSFFEKILSLLRVRTIVAGMEVSDQAIRLVHFAKGVWQLHAIRLEPGIMENGVIKDKDAFIASLVELKTKSGISGGSKRKINVVVSLSSGSPYIKTFKLPEIEGEDLGKAVELNLEIASPGSASETYSGWEMIGREEAAGQVDILSGFIDRPIVDAAVDALFSAGYIPMAIESKSLALTRVFREKGSGIDLQKPYILVDVDSDGVQFLVVRDGALYFEYSHRWADIENAKGEISMEAFEDELKTSLRQVLNFYAQQWTEPLAAVVLSAVAFHDEIERVIAENISLPAVRLTLLMGQPISSEWLVALGCNLRGAVGEKSSNEINFLGVELEDKFRAESLLVFLELWRVVVPIALVILIATFTFAGFILTSERLDIEVNYGGGPIANNGIVALVASSSIFNNEVAAIQDVENPGAPSNSAIISDLTSITAQEGVTISKLTSDGSSDIFLSGIASSQDAISTFKTALSADTHVSAVQLPLASIQPAGNAYTFQIEFSYK